MKVELKLQEEVEANSVRVGEFCHVWTYGKDGDGPYDRILMRIQDIKDNHMTVTEYDGKLIENEDFGVHYGLSYGVIPFIDIENGMLIFLPQYVDVEVVRQIEPMKLEGTLTKNY